MVMSDRIALLRSGELEQVAAPREIYQHPTSAYVAQFIGRTNLLKGEVRSGVVRCGSLSWPTSLPEGPAVFQCDPSMSVLALQVLQQMSPAFGAAYSTRRFTERPS